jgi:hypothetical protein
LARPTQTASTPTRRPSCCGGAARSTPTPDELRAVVGKVGADVQTVVRELIARIERRPMATSSPKRSLSRIPRR